MYMQFIVTITSQGQITIPAKIRRKLKLDKSKKAIVTVKNDEIVVTPEPDIMQLAGSLHKYAKKNMSIDEVIKMEERAWEDAVVEKYKKYRKK